MPAFKSASTEGHRFAQALRIGDSNSRPSRTEREVRDAVAAKIAADQDNVDGLDSGGTDRGLSDSHSVP